MADYVWLVEKAEGNGPSVTVTGVYWDPEAAKAAHPFKHPESQRWTRRGDDMWYDELETVITRYEVC